MSWRSVEGVDVTAFPESYLPNPDNVGGRDIDALNEDVSKFRATLAPTPRPAGRPEGTP
jgi:hypothetical protein